MIIMIVMIMIIMIITIIIKITIMIFIMIMIVMIIIIIVIMIIIIFIIDIIMIIIIIVIVPTIWKMGRNFVFGCFMGFFVLFRTQNQVPQIIIGMLWVIYHNKALSIVIWTLKNFKIFFHSVQKNWHFFLHFFDILFRFLVIFLQKLFSGKLFYYDFQICRSSCFCSDLFIRPCGEKTTII